MAEQRYADTTDGRGTPADGPGTLNPGTLRLHGITDAFLTRLEDSDGSVPDTHFSSMEEAAPVAKNGITGDAGPWYLYGRIAGQKTDDGTDAGHQPPRRQNAQDTQGAQNTQSTQNAQSAQGTAGIFLWTSPDLRQWDAPRKVLDVHDIPWATAQPTHPAVLRHDGRIYLYFEADGQIGATWASSPAGPFTVRRTPLLRRRIWGRATDPGVLGMRAEVDGFGQITPATTAGRSVRTDWLTWTSPTGGDGTVTLCTLSQDRMEFAPGIHRSREIRVTPEIPAIPPDATDAVASGGPHTSERSHSSEKAHSSSRSRTVSIVSPRLIRLDRRYLLLWAGDPARQDTPSGATPGTFSRTPSGATPKALWYARADRLNGPWEAASPLMTVADAQGDAQMTPLSIPASASVPTRVTPPVLTPVTSDGAVDRISVAATSARTERILTVSDGVSTSFFLLETSHRNPVVRDLSY